MKLNNLINSLTQEYYQKQRMATQDCQNACNNPYNVGPCYACTGQKAGAAIRIGNINSEIRSAKNKINLLENDLLNTDQIIYEEVSSPYTFVLNEINGLKESQFELFLIDGNDCFKSNVKIIEKKNFNIPSNISNQDTNKNLLSKYDSLDDVKIWEAEKMKNISEDEFLNIANNSIEKIDRKVLYASLNIAEDESFFDKIFSNKKKINKNFKKDKKTNVDNRFKSVVIIETLNSLGSGFFVKPNQVITNFHVVDGAKRITIKNFDGKRSSAKILKIDTRRDLALLETNFRGEPVKFYKSEIYAGLEVEAIGHPNGLDYSLTKGVVSNIRDYSSTYNVTQNANTKFIQTDVAINPGNSGGPLFHQDFVIGVNTQGLTKSKFEGLNFSVHLDELLDFLS